ncbi:MAG: hypothetical protein AB7H81_26210 [Vicinamibacterales bacterium]
MFAFAGLAEAQGRAGCASPQPPSIGIAFGRSSPHLELARGAVELHGHGTVAVRGGAQLAGRADLSLSGPLRLRIETARARWDIRQRTYSPDDFTVTADESVDHMSARHLVALAGLRLGRPPACAHVSAGGGVHALGFRGESVWRPGASLAAGIELPTGGHGVIQVDAMLHLIGTRDAHPIASSAVPSLNLLVGWAYRF